MMTNNYFRVGIYIRLSKEDLEKSKNSESESIKNQRKLIYKYLKDDNNNLTKVKVAEVAHSIFYAPQYAAISLGYFEENGIDVDLTLVPGAINLK